jgi:diguanylate cyclase (GGDEF)-like protein
LRALLLALVFAAPLLPAHAQGANATVGAPVSDARAELARWIQSGRARPEEAVAGLVASLPRLASDVDAEVEALVVLGELRIVLADTSGVDQVVEQLRRRSEGPGAATAEPTPAMLWARAGADAVRALQLREQGPVGRAERLLADALRALPDNTPDSLRLRLLTWHADLLHRAGKFESAARRFQEAIMLADTSSAPAWQRAELRSYLAKTLYLAGQVDRARELNQAALALAGQAADDKALSFAYKTEGIVQSGDSLAESPPAAEEAMRASLEFAQRAGAKRDEVRAIANLADMALRRADYVLALDYSDKALLLARALHDQGSESVALANAGYAKIMLGHKDEGLRLAQASMAVDERAGAPAEVASTQDELGHYLEKAGQFDDAYAAYSGYRRLAEQVFRSDLQRNLSELQESFDHERRRRELELLERENRLQHTQLVSRELQQWLWATGVLLAALLLALGSLLLRRLRAGNLQLVQANAQLERLSERDVLTGLTNRRGFQAAMQSSHRIEGTLMLVDVDHFKQINDRWGHAVGDVVLVELARRLRAALRDDDLIVRWGGEEFLLWAPAAPRAEAEALVARTLAAISKEPMSSGQDRIRVTVSIGFATFPIEPARLMLNWEQALELIDTSMYLAKSHGRNRAYGVRSANATSVAELSTLARSFETAWRDGKVELVAISGTPAPMEAGT